MGRKDCVYRCLKKRKRDNSAALKKATEVSFVLKTSDSNTTEAKLDLNARVVSGSIITGIGLSNPNEITASMDLPTMPFRLYSKKHDAIPDMWKAAA
ncbi:unnamed protein product [Arctia plantaginis]|uniref:Uncharacterized protein n=1 Tax=Arctia plantaginis TaxID=874455 RepID=A0A8S1BUU1_ARCPL|nr:unnamed protein product [Arctia plantaginis]